MKDQLHVRHEILDIFILMVLQLVLNSRKVHRVLDNVRIVGDAQRHMVHWIAENVRLLVPLKRLEDPLGGLLPLVEDRRGVGHLWHLELGQRCGVFALFVHFEVLCDLRVLSLEVLILGIGHGRVQPALTQHSEHVSSLYFTLILALLGLRLCRSRFLTAVRVGPATVTQWRTSTLQKQIQDLLFVLFLGPVRRSHALLVDHLEVGALIDEELAHFVAILVDCVVDGPLVL